MIHSRGTRDAGPKGTRLRQGAWYTSAAIAALLLAAQLGACSDSKSAVSGEGGRVEAIPPSSVPPGGGPEIGTPAQNLMSADPRPAQTFFGKGAQALPAAVGQAAAPANPVQAFLASDAGRLQSELDQIKARVANRDASLQQIRNGLAADASAYNTATGSVGAGLQSGKAPDDPVLLGQWTNAQAALARMDGKMAQLIALSVQSAQDASVADYIADSAKRAGEIQGSTADRQRLAAIQADATAAGGASRTQKTAIGAEIERQTANVTRERAGLMQLASAIEGGTLYQASKGPNPSMQRAAPKPAAVTAHSGPSAAPASPPGDFEGKKPLVVIRFDQPNVQYDEPVRTAATMALERKPTAIFDVVASAPADGVPKTVASARDKSKADAEGVVRSLMNAGVPSSQLTLTLATAQAGGPSEVRIFVR